jgi:hypothetical protein
MKFNLENFKNILNKNYFLVATSNSLEKNAVNERLDFKIKLELDLKSNGCYIGLIDGNIIIHISGTSGIVAETSIGRIILEFVLNNKYPIPATVLLVGFCWGNPNFTKVGDVIICNSIISLNSEILNKSDNNYKINHFNSSLTEKYLDGLSLNGTMASLEKLFADTSLRNDLIEKFPIILGGEMEGFSFIPTLNSKDIPWLIVKTVSDFGDNSYDKVNQKLSANLAVDKISVLIEELKIKSKISDYLEQKKSNNIINILKGQSVKINRLDFTLDTLNDYLNNSIGPIVDAKLKEYFYDLNFENGGNFSKYFCSAILEIAQNSFRHGKTSNFEITFNTKSISIDYDGDDYELMEITGGKGGAVAWNDLFTSFIKNGLVKYSHDKKNNYNFKLEQYDFQLKELIKNCSIEIAPGTIRAGYYPEETLIYNKNCTSVYLNDLNNRMPSRRFSMIDEVKKLLEKGITVYVHVDDESAGKAYVDALVEFGDKLKILIA